MLCTYDEKEFEDQSYVQFCVEKEVQPLSRKADMLWKKERESWIKHGPHMSKDRFRECHEFLRIVFQKASLALRLGENEEILTWIFEHGIMPERFEYSFQNSKLFRQGFECVNDKLAHMCKSKKVMESSCVAEDMWLSYAVQILQDSQNGGLRYLIEIANDEVVAILRRAGIKPVLKQDRQSGESMWDFNAEYNKKIRSLYDTLLQNFANHLDLVAFPSNQTFLGLWDSEFCYEAICEKRVGYPEHMTPSEWFEAWKTHEPAHPTYPEQNAIHMDIQRTSSFRYQKDKESARLNES